MKAGRAAIGARVIDLEAGQLVTVRRSLQPRLCAWCLRKPVESRGGKYCSHSCRQRAYEHRRLVEQLLAAIDRGLRHVETLHAALERTLAARHIISPRIEEESPNAQ